MKSVFAWLRDRPDVADRRIGGWGVSYGGGAAWNSLAAGVPWAALEISMSWTDLRDALVPQGLAKTGVIAGFLGSLDPKRVDPEVFALRDAAFAGNLSTVGPFAAARSSLPDLKGVKTPVFMMQGRRDFAFGLEHALNAYRALAGPKQLWLGLSGHAPSQGVAADTPAMLAEGARWFDRFLRGDTAAPLPKPVAISPENWKGQPRRFTALPKVVAMRSTFGVDSVGRARIAQAGRYRIPLPRLGRPLEVFGSPGVSVTANATGGWSRIVAVLSARTPAGKEIVVAGGGVPTRAGKRAYRIALSNQATFLPKGSRLTLTIGSSSLAQNPANLLYLDLPFPSTARLDRHRRLHADPRAGDTGLAMRRCARRPRRRAPRGRRRRRCDDRRPGRHPDDDPDRRHRPAHRRGCRVRRRRPGREGVLRLRQLEGRRERAEDRVPLLRRRLQPGADRPADTAARRAGRRLRDLQRGRHREQPRDPRLPQRAEGAPALRRRRVGGARRRLGPVPVDGRLPAELPGRGRGARARRRPDEAAREDRGAAREHGARQGHDPRPLPRDRRQGPADRRLGAVRADHDRRRRADREAEVLRRGHADALRHPEVHDPGDRRDQEARAGSRSSTSRPCRSSRRSWRSRRRTHPT